jgi:hypothetical protein
MSIRLSDKHGVIPSVSKCYLCGKDKGLVLFGRLKNDEEAPRSAVYDKEPCDECKELQKLGVILISVRDGSSPEEEPVRTGEFAVVKDEAVLRIFGGLFGEVGAEEAKRMVRSRAAFVEDEMWDLIELPRGQTIDNRGEPDDAAE